MVQNILSNAVALDVATGKKQYVKPQMEVVELENQASILMASNRSFGAGFDGGIDEEDI